MQRLRRRDHLDQDEGRQKHAVRRNADMVHRRPGRKGPTGHRGRRDDPMHVCGEHRNRDRVGIYSSLVDMPGGGAFQEEQTKMKKERLTQWGPDGASLISDGPAADKEAYTKLAEIEDKIARGTLVEIATAAGKIITRSQFDEIVKQLEEEIKTRHQLEGVIYSIREKTIIATMKTLREVRGSDDDPEDLTEWSRGWNSAIDAAEEAITEHFDMLKKTEIEEAAARRVVTKFTKYMSCCICPYDQKCEIKNDPHLCPTKCLQHILAIAKKEIAEETALRRAEMKHFL